MAIKKTKGTIVLSSSPFQMLTFSKKRRMILRDVREYKNSRAEPENSSKCARWKAGNLTPRSPVESDWWVEKREEGDGEDKEEEKRSGEKESRFEFHNCGLSTWEKAREEWRKQIVKERPRRPPSIRYSEIESGLMLRTYELPIRMTLTDMVDMFVEIWEGSES